MRKKKRKTYASGAGERKGKTKASFKAELLIRKLFVRK